MRTCPGLLLLAIVAACGGDDGAGPDGPPGGPDAGGSPPEFRVDAIGQVAMIEGWGVFATLYDRPFEIPLPTEVARAGDCAVFHRPTPSCPAGCTGNDVCVADATCGPMAAYTSAGDIEITGLREPATLTAGQFGYQSPNLPADFFADDAAIHVSAPGGAIPAFDADVGGVAPLVDQTAGFVEVHDGQDHTVRWTADAGGARIQLALYLGWHGSPWTDLLVCETADDGELVIPAALIDAMPYFEKGLFQWPSWISRFRRAWVTVPAGPIEVIASSQVGIGFAHPAEQ